MNMTKTQLSQNQAVVLDQLHRHMAHIVTEYDRKQSSKRGYNPYALAHYLGAVQAVCKELGENPEMLTRTAIVEHFKGRLCDVILKALGFAKQTDDELRG